ncbi:MAG: hypothetical protein ACP5P3_00285 [Ignavibacteria bacterium]
MKFFTNLNKNEKLLLLFIILTPFAIKVILAFSLNTTLRSDSMVYDNLAKSILYTGSYSFNGKPTAVLSCGYPLFLSLLYAIFGTEQISVKFFQSFIEIFSILVFFLVSTKFFKTKYALVSTAIFAFFPSNILFSQTILTEPLFGFLSLILLNYCLGKKFPDGIFFIGLLWGYAVLVRASFIFSLALIPFYIFFFRKQIFEGYSKARFFKFIKFSFIFLCGVALVIAPWLIRNKLVIGTFTIATQGGFTFWAGSNPNATGTWYHKIEETDERFNIDDEALRDKLFYKEGLKYAINNPHKFFITGIKKLGYLFSSERMILLYFTPDEGKVRTSTEVYRDINPLFIGFVNIPYFIVMILGTFGILSFTEKRFFIYGFIISWLLVFFLFVALARYHYVLIPFFVLGTTQTLFLRKRLFQEMQPLRIIIAVVFCLFLISVWTIEFYNLLK